MIVGCDQELKLPCNFSLSISDVYLQSLIKDKGEFIFEYKKKETMKKLALLYIAFITFMIACKQSDHPIVQPEIVTTTVDLSHIRFIDSDMGRAENSDNPFEYLFIQLYNTGQTYFEPGMTASGIYEYAQIPASVDFEVLEGETYTLELKTLDEGTGFGLADEVTPFNALDYENPENVISPLNHSNVYLAQDSSEFAFQRNPELDVYYHHSQFTADQADNTLEVNLHRMAFGVELEVLQCEEGIITVLLNPDNNETSLALDYPSQSYNSKILSLESYSNENGLPIISNPLIPTKITFESPSIGTDTTLFEGFLVYSRLQTKRIEIDLPEIYSPEAVSEGFSWINFTEQPLSPGDTLTIN